MGVALINILPLHPPQIIQGRVDFESDDDDDALESPTESDSEDEYMDEYSYDSWFWWLRWQGAKPFQSG